jgi:uridine kinase
MLACVVGISGGTCSGKTTLAQLLAQRFGRDCVTVSQDWYYRDLAALPPEARAQSNFDAPDAIEASLLATHVAALAEGENVKVPQYDFALHTRCAKTLRLAPAPIILVEGLHVIGMPELAELLTLRVFVEASDAVRLARRLARDTQERGRTAAQVTAQFEATVRPMHARFVAPLGAGADVVIHGGERLESAVALLADWITRFLRGDG